MLIAAAAARWKVAGSECTAANSTVTHPPSGRNVTFGRIAADAAAIAPSAQVALKDPKDWKLIGTRQNRLEVADKVTGKLIYAIDVRLPNMLYAAIVQCPVFKGTVRSVDESKLAGLQGHPPGGEAGGLGGGRGGYVVAGEKGGRDAAGELGCRRQWRRFERHDSRRGVRA